RRHVARRHRHEQDELAHQNLPTTATPLCVGVMTSGFPVNHSTAAPIAPTAATPNATSAPIASLWPELVNELAFAASAHGVRASGHSLNASSRLPVAVTPRMTPAARLATPTPAAPSASLRLVVNNDGAGRGGSIVGCSGFCNGGGGVALFTSAGISTF